VADDGVAGVVHAAPAIDHGGIQVRSERGIAMFDKEAIKNHVVGVIGNHVKGVAILSAPIHKII
jgi:hypothetical protein